MKYIEQLTKYVERLVNTILVLMMLCLVYSIFASYIIPELKEGDVSLISKGWRNNNEQR